MSVATPLAVALWASTANAATLQDELGFMLETHPQLKSSEYNVRATEENIREARARFYPSVTARGDTGWSSIDNPTRRNAGQDDFEGRSDRAVLRGEVNVFDGFRKYAELDRAQLETKVAALNFDVTLQQLMFEGASAYIGVLRQNQLRGIAVQSERTIQRQLSLEDERVRRGSGLSVDVLQSKSRLQIAKESRVTIEGELQNAQARYLEVFGKPAEVASMVEPNPPVEPLPASLEEAIARAREANPNIEIASRRIDIAGERVRSAKSEYFPRVDFVLEGTRENNVDAITGMRRELAAKVEARWSLFDGFAREARVSRAQHQQAASRTDNTYADRQLVENVESAWVTLQTARERRALLENAINIATEVFEARRKLRDSGKETVINVLDAENEVNTARLRFTAAHFDSLLAVYRLYYAMGILTPETLNLAVASAAPAPQ